LRLSLAPVLAHACARTFILAIRDHLLGEGR